MSDHLKEYKAYYHSEIGLLEIVGTEEYIKLIYFIEPEVRNNSVDTVQLPQVVTDCVAQLEEYFNGKRQKFELNLGFEGTEFQKSVWRQLTNVSFGKTVS